MVRFPHTLRYDAVAISPSVRDENGKWIVPAPGVPDMQTVECRAVPSGAGNKGNTERIIDGQKIDFAFLVYLPSDCPEFINGLSIEILNGATVVVSAPIKDFHRGQPGTNARIWV